MGAAIIFLLISGLVQLGTSRQPDDGGDRRRSCSRPWASTSSGSRTRARCCRRSTSVPSWVDFQPPPSIERDSGTVFAENDRLQECRGDRARSDRGARGHHPRPPRQPLYRQSQRLDHPLPGAGLQRSRGICAHRRPAARPGASTASENLLVCIAGMGVYGVKPDRTVFKVTDRDQPHLVPASRTIRGSGLPTISTSRPTARSISAKRPRATI